MPGGSGGADTSVVTATAEDVLAPKVIVGPDGEPITGEMANNGAVSHSLPVNGNYVIPKGFHNGAGKVSQSIPTQGGSTTVPGTAAKTIVAANRYVTGNVVVAGDPNLIPANIKKNVTIFGVRGTHSGYVPSATDLYLRGNNPSNITGYDNGYVYARLESGQISVGSSSSSLGARTVAISSNKPCDFSGYSKLNLEIVGYNNTQPNITLYALATPHQGITGPGQYLANTQYMDLPDTTTVISLDIANINQVGYVGIAIGMFVRVAIVCAVFRVWLS